MRKLMKLLPLFLLVGVLATSCSDDDDDNKALAANHLVFGDKILSLEDAVLVYHRMEINEVGDTIYRLDLEIYSDEVEGGDIPSEIASLTINFVSTEKDGLASGTYTYGDGTKAVTYMASEVSLSYNLSAYEEDEEGDMTPTKGEAYYSSGDLGGISVRREGSNYVISGNGNVPAIKINLENQTTTTETLDFKFNYTGKPSYIID